MKKARHVATGKLVDASKVDYEDYYGIFECPHCKAALKLRKEYIRAGVTISAAFIHPAHGTDAQKNCPLRVSLDFSEASSDSASRLSDSRGQFYKVLKGKLIKHLKLHSTDGIWEYYNNHHVSPEITRKDINILLRLSNALLKLPQNSLYILKQKESIKNLLEPRYNNYEEIEKNMNKVTWVIDFLVHEADDKFRKKVLNYILGKYIFEGDNSPKYAFMLDDIDDIDIVLEIIEEPLIFLGFKKRTFKTIEKVVLNQELAKKFYIQLYEGQFSENYSVGFEKVKSFHNILFNYIIKYLINFNFTYLIYSY